MRNRHFKNPSGLAALFVASIFVAFPGAALAALCALLETGRDSGTPVGDVCRQLGVSEATFYVWKKSTASSA
jgi:Transposase